jgi:hypothetical protein
MGLCPALLLCISDPVIVFLLKQNPINFGLRPGDWRTWGFFVLISCVVAVLVLYAASLLPSI